MGYNDRDIDYKELRLKRRKIRKKQRIINNIIKISILVMFLIIGVMIGIQIGKDKGIIKYKKTKTVSYDNVKYTDLEKDPTPDVNAKGIICLDAGHGFDDPGTSEGFINCSEKDITIAVVKLLKKELENRGFQVVLTHDGKCFKSEKDVMEQADKLSLSYDSGKFETNNIFSAYERTIYANVLDASFDFDYFLSLHVNSYEDSSDVDGFLIACCDKTDTYDESYRELENITNRLSNTFHDKYMRTKIDSYDDAYIVTKYSTMPSVLLEMGYATNEDDAENLLNDNWRRDFVCAVADGIEDCFK